MINKPTKTIDERIHECKEGIRILTRKDLRTHEVSEEERETWMKLIHKRLFELELEKQNQAKSFVKYISSEEQHNFRSL